jgi:hypothetical protein
LTISGSGATRVLYVADGVDVTLQGLTVSGGWLPSGNDGAGIFSYGNLTLQNVRVADNHIAPGSGTNNGGGIFGMNSSLTVIDSTIENNSATWQGGIGMLLSERQYLHISGSSIINNTASAGGGIGLMGNGADVSIVNSTISGNTSGWRGGGIWTDYGTTPVSIVNTTITRNTSLSDGAGGVFAGSPTTLKNSIVAQNSGTTVWGGSYFQTHADLYGTFDADNSSYNVIGIVGWSGLSTDSAHHNVMGTETAPLDARLSDLGNYGGTTKTNVPLVGSPAIDAGNGAAALGLDGQPLSLDQRGRARVVYAIDAGAVEHEVLGDYNGNGTVDTGDYLLWRSALGSNTNLIADGDGSGQVDDNDYEIWRDHYGNTAGPNLSAAYGIYVVSTAQDESDGDYSAGDLSLREALSLTTTHAGPDQIVFRHELSGQTITLSSSLGQLSVNSQVEIAGRGADQLTVSGDGMVRVFSVAS